MPLDVLGRTRATLTHATSFSFFERGGQSLNVRRDRDRLLQLLILNEEFLVNANHQFALITSLPFVHTARRIYRLSVSMKCRDFYNYSLLNSYKGNFLESLRLEEDEVVTRFP